MSILRAVWINDTFYSKDVTWDFVAINNWTAVEVNVAILVPCLIVLKPLLARLLPSLSTPQHSNHNSEAPPTIGSDPRVLEQPCDGIDNVVDSSEASSFHHGYEAGNKEARHVESSIT